MSIVEQVRLAGVVGAGGGGFPAHVKLSGKADTVIANGAECEPLLYKDATVMEEQAADVVRGLQLAMEAVGAKRGVIGVKAKKKHAVEAMQEATKGTGVEVQLLGDYYPAGDEYDLVFTVTGRLIPPQGIPLNVGVVVNNVETFANMARAVQGQPVIRKTLTVAGAVSTPVTITVPVGTSFRECLQAAGGATTAHPVICVGGLMMGQVTTNLEDPVTKTCTGLVVLPREHPLMQRKLQPAPRMAHIGKSACDQCRYCTEYCPRYLLGYAVEPHQVMRTLAFTSTGEAYFNAWASLCCSCGLCTLFACPEGLFPKEACDDAKGAMRRANQKWSGKMEVQVHPLREGRRVPIKALVHRMGVDEYDVPAPYRAESLAPRQAVLPLRQSAGAPTVPAVKAGDTVREGQPVSAPAPQALGAIIHAPFGARVTAVTAEAITLERI
jgi:Na+-translocating ferredoxin:NAD+ oxidoreductase RnfC subunit